MRLRPFHLWWLGVLLFAPSLLVWVLAIGISIYMGGFSWPFDWFHIRSLYLPLFAALAGFTVPAVCMRLLRAVSWRVTSWAFAAYLAVFLTWGIIDIRNENHQMGGHRYPNGPLLDGHKYYWHQYYTWYFIPYRWIERGIQG